MATWWLSAHDASHYFHCEAKDAGEAFELFARSLRYASFDEMGADLGYTRSDFNVAKVEDQRWKLPYTDAEVMANLSREREGIVVAAMKHLRKLARG